MSVFSVVGLTVVMDDDDGMTDFRRSNEPFGGTSNASPSGVTIMFRCGKIRGSTYSPSTTPF